MKVLLDTNIVIHRENQIASNYSIGHLYRWIDRLTYTKVIHPSTVEEIRSYKDRSRKEALEVKLSAYELLHGASEPTLDFLSKLPAPKDDNDQIDHELLYEVFAEYIDMLITEDKRLRRKARLLGIDDKVLSIEDFIGLQSKLHPDLIEYSMLAVRQSTFRELDLTDPFFDSLRMDYPGFDSWFRSKSIEKAYVCHDDKGALLGFLYLKTEETGENYGDISPHFSPARRLKIGTFKVESTGFRLGERFLPIVFDNAVERHVDEIYLTALPAGPSRNQIAYLIDLIKSWGFTYFGEKTSPAGCEEVYVKRLGHYDDRLSVKQNFPNMLFKGRRKYILPIYPKYHTHLFPDSILRTENPSNFVSNAGFRYALQKIYISFTSNRDMRVGDYVFIYRTGEREGRKGFESVVTTLGIITELKPRFQDWQHFRRYCGNRTVFTEDELEEIWKNKRQTMLVVSFIFAASLRKRPNLGKLWDNGIIPRSTGPRPFHELSDHDFDRILQWSESELRFVDRGNKQ
jgi:rRNA-processing protein FCF1